MLFQLLENDRHGALELRVTPEGHVKILDFGLSRRPISSAPKADGEPSSFNTSDGRVIGTAHYMAPEQAHGKTADVRCDLFSLGVILYQLVTGRVPFTGGTYLEVLYSVANVDPPPLARYATHVPDELQRIVDKLLAKEPDRRYQSAHEVLTDLERLRQGLHQHHVRERFPLWMKPLGVAATAIPIFAAAVELAAMGSCAQSLARGHAIRESHRRSATRLHERGDRDRHPWRPRAWNPVQHFEPLFGPGDLQGPDQ